MFRTLQKGLYISNKFDEATKKLMLVKTGSANRICWTLMNPLDLEEEEEVAEVDNQLAVRDKSLTTPVRNPKPVHALTD